MALYMNDTKVGAALPIGITPTGNIDITDTQSTDVTNYATAKVVDADLVAGNIKKDVNVLGVVGTYEGGGWVRPAGWPDLDSLTIPDNFRGALLSVVNEAGNASTFKVCFWGWKSKAEICHIENNELVVEETYTSDYYSQIELTVTGTKVVRLTPNQVTSSSEYRGYNNAIQEDDAVVEMYIYKTMFFDVAPRVEHVKFIECYAGGINSLCSSASNLVSVAFDNCTNSNSCRIDYLMYSNCIALKRLDLSWMTASPSNASQSLNGAKSLEYCDMRNIDLSSAGNPDITIGGAPNLVSLFVNLPASNNWSLSYNFRLSRESLLYIIGHIASTETSRTLTLGACNRSKLSSEEIAVATNKGWTVA